MCADLSDVFMIYFFVFVYLVGAGKTWLDPLRVEKG